jgi:hypothetical protein
VYRHLARLALKRPRSAERPHGEDGRKSLKNYKVMAVLHLPEAREDFATLDSVTTPFSFESSTSFLANLVIFWSRFISLEKRAA